MSYLKDRLSYLKRFAGLLYFFWYALLFFAAKSSLLALSVFSLFLLVSLPMFAEV